jgi:xylan 1,4-beta-xylosidase
MKKTIIIALLIQLTFLAYAQYQINSTDKGTGFYLNPVFAGDYPDPSLLREGSDYYIVHSSFDYYPGLLIWHSKDLINWTPVTHALHKYVGSVWAPDLIKFKNKYYIYFPANNTNFVVTADKISGPWSEPVDLKVGNIDPGHVTDENGKRYLYFSGGGYVPLSDDGLSVTGELKQAYNGWPIPREWSIECFCLEGPKLLKHGNYYYLIMAEGGTAGPPTSHMVVAARSKSPFGPWENSPYNPVVRTSNISEKWWSTGHGTLFEDANGKWWMVFHGYEKGLANMGRQTLLLPMEWTNDGWFKTPGGIRTGDPIKRPGGEAAKQAFSLSDSFDGNQLKPQWQFFGEYDNTRYRFADNRLAIKAKGDSISDCSPLLCIPSDKSYIAEVEITIEGKATGGLVIFYNKKAHSGILADNEDVIANLQRWQFPAEKKVIKNHVFLRLKKVENIVDMYYSTDGIKWNKIENSVEVSALQHNVLGGFLSLRLGLCAFGDGIVTFNNFTYKAIK